MSLRNLTTLGTTTMWLLLAVPAALAVGLAGGCTSETVTTAPPVGPVYDLPGEADFCTALATAKCSSAVVAACYGSASDTSQCITADNVQSKCNPGNRMTYHPENADACIATVKSVYANTSLTHADFKQITTDCDPVFEGNGIAGAPCMADADCALSNGFQCIKSVCNAPVTKSAGESCAGSADTCGNGNYCDPASTHCFTDGTAGEKCSVTAPCDATQFRCDTSATNYTCVALAADGAACTADAECVGFCKVGLHGGHCFPTFTFDSAANTCNEFLSAN